MSRYYYDKDNLWWQIIAIVFTLTLCFLFIYWAFHPAPRQTPLQDARDHYVFSCNGVDGIVNVGSDNYKDWTCKR